MTTPENKVKAAVKKALTNFGAYNFPVQSAGLGEAGHPDRVACIDGQFYGIECKATARNHPTELQTRRLTAITASGGYAFVVDADNFDRWIQIMYDLTNPQMRETAEARMRAVKTYWR